MPLSTQQQTQLNTWLKQLRDSSRSSHTIKKYAYWLTRLGETYPKPFDKITQKQLVAFIRNLKDKGTEPSSCNTVRSAIRQFYTKGLEQPEKLNHPFLKQQPVTITKPEIPTENELMQLIMATTNARDRAILALLIEGGMRVGALAKFPKGAKFKGQPYMCIGDVKFKTEPGKTRYYLVHIRKTKTGEERHVPIVELQAFLSHWLRLHPAPDNPENPLFCYQQDGELYPLSYNRIWRIVQLSQQHAGITKEIHPHLFRKAWATREYNKGTQERDLAILGGWKPGSKTMNRYIWADESLVIERHLKKKGIIPAEASPAPPSELTSVTCPNCQEPNSANAVICQRCAVPLDKDLARRMRESINHTRSMEAQTRKELNALKKQLAEQETYIEELEKSFTSPGSKFMDKALVYLVAHPESTWKLRRNIEKFKPFFDRFVERFLEYEWDEDKDRAVDVVEAVWGEIAEEDKVAASYRKKRLKEKQQYVDSCEKKQKS